MVFDLLTFLHLLAVVVVSLRIFSRRTSHGTALAWLLLIITLPAVGVLMYLMIGERRLGKIWMDRAIAMQPQLLRWAQDIPASTLVDPSTLSSAAESVSRLATGSVGLPLMGGHRLQLLTDSSSIMRALIADIDAARSSVHLEFYIWSAGGFVDDLVAALVRAAQRGVPCSTLMDSLGSRPFFKSQAIGRLRDAGVNIVEVLPVNPLRALFVRFDLRDHRKIAVIDRRIAYTGSMNIADPRFFKQNAGVGQWVDAMVRIEGPAAWVLEAVSLSLTALQTGSDFAPPPPPDLAAAGDSHVQIFPSGPQSSTQHIEQLLVGALYAAKREIVLTTPYFIPSETLLTALCSAAIRGVRVILIVPEKIDSTLVRYASNAYVDDLLAVGITILRFGDGLLHTKSMVVDEEITIFGTVNLDLRSFELNFEVSMLTYDREFSAAARAMQRHYESKSEPLQLQRWRGRPDWRRRLENAVQVLSPLL
ncbi:MAG: Cardiolipin synthase [Candidatus Accumulibacter appositus]|uniref:Cardiolipin synthase n=1 Tax=Candidatus Accumulibacter appositus TaxID=1454003 RepID=A0A011QLJ9_9PROT|nr:cardiolipin synthase [Accumulibacter sp.]EXI79754.1 MAG: Cardiolipin synthase [Candidatus Accumulibacter appositus]HRF05188.1 cardiolipin synthase [Accumulibacter sp.]